MHSGLALWRRLRRSAIGTLGLAVTGLLALVAVLGPMLYGVAPMTMGDAVLEPPSFDFAFGTDQFGRDILSRTLSGLRISFSVGFASVLVGGLIGVSSGLIAGYLGGWFEIVTQRLWDGLMAFPGALLGIAVAAVSGPGSGSVVLAAGLISVPFFSRLVRAQTLVEKNKDYVTAARCVGASSARILGRHVLPNCVSPILVQASVAMSQAMLLEAALSFLGLGVQPPEPSLGTMLNESRNYLGQADWFAIFPGLVLVLLLMAVNFLSDGLHEILLPRQS
jgi:peptide/nickel transport system permease protein